VAHRRNIQTNRARQKGQPRSAPRSKADGFVVRDRREAWTHSAACVHRGERFIAWRRSKTICLGECSTDAGVDVGVAADQADALESLD